MGEENPAAGNTTKLKPGESTAPYRFVTAGWAPGRYRIVSDCGVSREILLRALPSVTPAGTACPPGNEYLALYQGKSGKQPVCGGTIHHYRDNKPCSRGRTPVFHLCHRLRNNGTLPLPKLVSSSTTVSAGKCGTNTWSVDGVIADPRRLLYRHIQQRKHRFSCQAFHGPPKSTPDGDNDSR